MLPPPRRAPGQSQWKNLALSTRHLSLVRLPPADGDEDRGATWIGLQFAAESAAPPPGTFPGDSDVWRRALDLATALASYCRRVDAALRDPIAEGRQGPLETRLVYSSPRMEALLRRRRVDAGEPHGALCRLDHRERGAEARLPLDPQPVFGGEPG